MSDKNELTTAEQIARWADQLRDLSAMGLKYAADPYDQERYVVIQNIVVEMLAVATLDTVDSLEPLRETVLARVSPTAAGTAAVIDAEDRILLMRRSDNGLWNMPGGVLEVGESPADGAVRETLEETGVHCRPIALVGVYDSNVWDIGKPQQIYKFTFLCQPTGEPNSIPSHAHESLEVGWFKRDELPVDLYVGHVQRVADAFDMKAGNRVKAHFDFE